MLLPVMASRPRVITEPDGFAGLQTWYRSDEVVLDGVSGDVETWTDKSGNGNDATQATDAAQPSVVAAQLNGHAAINFDGGDFLSAGDVEVHSNTTGLTIAIVAKSDNSGEVYFSKHNAGASQRQWRAECDTWDIQTDPAAFNAGTNIGFSRQATPAIHTMWWEAGGRPTVSINGGAASISVETCPSITDTAAPLMIGSREGGTVAFLNGDIYEIIAYNTTSAALRNGLLTYLRDRYAL